MMIYVDENVPQKIPAPIEDRANLVVSMLRKHKDKLQGTCTFLSEAAIDIRRPLK